LTPPTKRFLAPVEVISGGSGTLRGIISETDQSQVPSYIFVAPRHVFRVMSPTATRLGMVIRTPNGEVYIVGDNGPSEHAQGTLWESFRLFRATHRLPWRQRTTIIDPVTKQKTEGPLVSRGDIWIAVEPTDREEAERRMNSSFERARYITPADVEADDLIGDHKVIRADLQLGLKIGFLQC
jgi:hypothetical protein